MVQVLKFKYAQRIVVCMCEKLPPPLSTAFSTMSTIRWDLGAGSFPFGLPGPK